MIEADLHTHSHHSDGVLSPAAVVAMGVKAGLKALALTDHDTVDGVEEALSAAPPGFTVIPGVELSSSFNGREIHLLAYYPEGVEPGVKEFLEPLRRERRARAERMVARLRQAGVPMTFEEVLEVAAAGRPAGPSPSAAIGRPHLAEVLVKHGAARDIDDAFARYLRRGQPGYVAKTCLPVGEAMRFVRAHGGAVVVAHPALNLAESDTEALARAGLDGIEVAHPKHAADQRAGLLELTRRLGLVASGGSDYHGGGRGRHEVACAGVPMTAVEQLRRMAGKRRAP